MCTKVTQQFHCRYVLTSLTNGTCTKHHIPQKAAGVWVALQHIASFFLYEAGRKIVIK